MRFIEALATTPLLQMAIFAGLLASFASGIVGSYVVTKRIVSLSGSIAHSVLSGMGCALWLNTRFNLTFITPVQGALVAALLSALIIGWVHLHYKEREDAIIAMVWSIGMATGVIFVAHIPGFNTELVHFLLGNILFVNVSDLIILGVLDVVLLAVVLLFHKRFLALCFDEKQALMQGLPVKRLYLLLLCLVSVTVVLLINVVGIILVLSMLALPPSIAGTFTRRLPQMMGIAILLNVLFTVGGLALSYRLNWPTGPTIALFAGAIYLLSLKFKHHSVAA